jgi:hypothetical protein
MTDRMTTVDAETRQAVAAAGGRGRAEALTAAQRSEIARAGARAANSPAGRARSIVKAWAALTRAERAEIREILAPLMATRGSRGQGR